MMQLALPSLRSERALKTFRSSLKRWDYDLEAWRKAAGLSRFETEFLDADRGACHVHASTPQAPGVLGVP
jgi:hypothetical protein